MDMDVLPVHLDWLEGSGIPCEVDQPLGPRTWYGLGGPADLFAHPQSHEQFASLLRYATEARLPVHILGDGANLLVADAGVRGLVIRLDAPAFQRIDIDGPTVTAGAGVNLAKLILTTARQGLAGLEGLAGIPASVGGAIRMNAGGAYGEIGQHIARLICMDAQGQLFHTPREELRFGYRRSEIAHPYIIEAVFELAPGDPHALRERYKEILAWKTGRQPLGAHSAGCAFKNPAADISDKSAGMLIDEAGLKGYRVGGAEVSPHHANFVVVHPGATASDVLAVMRHVQQVVQDRFGIYLEREVVVWGDDA